MTGPRPVASSAPGGAIALRASFQRWRVLVQRNGKLLVQGVAQTLANEIHSGGKHSPGTPIRTGFHRANWDAAIDTVPAGGTAGTPGESLARMHDVAAQLTVGETWTAANSGPAIGRLEFDGWSPQAPDGFVRPAARAIQQIVDEVGAHLESR